MSSLIFYLDADNVLISTDTLAVSADDNAPFIFSTKFFPLPHIHAVICGTGFMDFVNHWVVTVNSGTLVDDVLHLNHHTPCALRNLKANMGQHFPVGKTVTIYHFGFPSDGGPPRGFAYRSENDFISEPLPNGAIGIKPEGDIPDDFTMPRDFEKIMHSQRAKQASEPDKKRVYIGGDILVCAMNRRTASVYQIASFPDKLAHRALMYEKFGKSKAP